jgi:uncharacterized protein YbjT (DUF2867 family)
MKVLVIGGTGLVGAKLVERLRADGHEALASSDALEGAQVVVDVSTALSGDDSPVPDLLAQESAAGVAHHVALSLVAGDRLEEVVEAGPVPYTILRTTPLFELIGRIADSSAAGDTVRLPAARIQPVAADDVASALADVALGSPLNDTVELAGPEEFRLDELARRVLDASGDPREVETDLHARYLDGRTLTPGDDARIASTRFEDWISRSS